MSLGREHQQAFVSGLAAGADQAIVTAVPGARIRVLAATFSAGAAASTAVLNTKPAGAGSAIGSLINLPINGTVVLPAEALWCQTNVGEGLTVTTVGAGPTAITVVYTLIRR